MSHKIPLGLIITRISIVSLISVNFIQAEQSVKEFSYSWSRVLVAVLISLVTARVGLAADPVYLNTPEGIQRLNQTNLSQPYFQVAPYVDTQENMGFCGPASIAAVLNSLTNLPRPTSGLYAPYRYFTQGGLFNEETSQIKSYEAVARGGLTLSEASRFLEQFKVSNQIYYGADLSIESLRLLLLRALSDPNTRIIADFDRRVFNQSGNGHYSPLVAYDPATDSVLILDVAKFKYPPFWVTVTDLLSSIQTIDPDSQKSRGIILVFEKGLGE
jgi:hypothetical protein